MAEQNEAQPGVRAEMVIRYLDNGQITVTGPLGDKLLCYGLLGMAGQIVAKHEQKPNLIVPQPMIDPRKLRGN